MSHLKITKKSLYIFTAIIIAGLIIGGLLFLRQTSQGENLSFLASLATSENNPADSFNEKEADYPALGDSLAPVTMTVFSDFQCHFCKKFAKEIKPTIIEKYVETGKVKLVSRDYAFLSKESSWAAEASHCADEQEKYWEYLEMLHSVQEGHDPSAFSRDNLKKLAQDLGLETEQFNQCFDSGKYVQLVKDSFEQGKRLGVKGTPTVFINNQKINGAQPLNVFEQAIEEELKINQ